MVKAHHTGAIVIAQELSARSPRHDGVPLRTYVLQDLDHDGRFEILEYVSAFENTPGFMNAELNGAFEWINVYAHGGEGFTERTAAFAAFLMQRRARYLFWIRVLQSSDVLSADSRGLVEANREDFLAILHDYLRRIEAMQ